MTIPELFQRQTAREEAMHHYSIAFDTFAERAQMYASEGVDDVARDVAGAADLFLRAYKAEMRDPEPRFAPSCLCPPCRRYRMTAPLQAPHPSEVIRG